MQNDFIVLFLIIFIYIICNNFLSINLGNKKVALELVDSYVKENSLFLKIKTKNLFGFSKIKVYRMKFFITEKFFENDIKKYLKEILNDIFLIRITNKKSFFSFYFLKKLLLFDSFSLKEMFFNNKEVNIYVKNLSFNNLEIIPIQYLPLSETKNIMFDLINQNLGVFNESETKNFFERLVFKSMNDTNKEKNK